MNKSKLTDELGKQIVELLKVGASIEDAADSLHLHRNTIHNWLRDGEKAHTGILRRFYEAAQKAKVTPKIKVINTVITRAIDGDMVAAKMYLSRFPEWNQQQTVKAEITNSPQITMFLPENDRDNL